MRNHILQMCYYLHGYTCYTDNSTIAKPYKKVDIFFQVFTLLVICSKNSVTMTAHHFPFLHRRSQSKMVHLQKCRSSLLAQVLHSTSQHHLNWKENGFFDTFKKFANVFETPCTYFFSTFKKFEKCYIHFFTLLRNMKISMFFWNF